MTTVETEPLVSVAPTTSVTTHDLEQVLEADMRRYGS
jgi:hypothetical protein